MDLCYKNLQKEFSLKQKGLNKRYGKKPHDEAEVEKKLGEYEAKRKELLEYVLGKRD